MIPVALVLALQVAAAGPSARPAECAPRDLSSTSNVWERAKSPKLRRYCDLLASAAAKLASNRVDEAREALAIAEEAARTMPDRAAPDALRGRALARLSRWPEAAAALEEARRRDEHALDDAAAILAWGRALARTGNAGDAEPAFRAVLPRAASLSASERAAAEIEAALLFERRGPAGLDDAVAALRQARRDAQDALQAFSASALALALDRAGQRDEARAVLEGLPRLEVRDPRVVVAEPEVVAVLADAACPYEADAVVATALDAQGDAAGAREAWGRYLAGPGGKGPWAEHARARAASPARAGRGR